MQKYCRKMKKRRVNFLCFVPMKWGIRRLSYLFCGLQSLKYARSVVVHWPVEMFPLASIHVSTGLWKHVYWPVETCTQASGRQLISVQNMTNYDKENG